MTYLYRGVNSALDLENEGRLYPAGSTMEVAILLDGQFLLDGTWHVGECEDNTARAQQKESGTYDAAGISTTRSAKEAIKFATSGMTEDGFVYVLDEKRLADLGVVMKEFLNPEHPHEHEVTLLIPGLRPVPEDAILDKVAVTSDGKSERSIMAKVISPS